MSGLDNQQGPGYTDSMSQDTQDQGMGGGAGTHGSGVAGGYEGSAAQSGNMQSQGDATQDQGAAAQAPGGTAQEKQDWLDKGIQGGGKKFGFNVSQQNADKAGDFMNKAFNKESGRNLPGVQ